MGAIVFFGYKDKGDSYDSARFIHLIFFLFFFFAFGPTLFNIYFQLNSAIRPTLTKQCVHSTVLPVKVVSFH